MDIDHLAEVVEAHLDEGLVAQDAGVVDQDIDPAEAFLDEGDHLVDGGGVGHGSAVGDRFTAGRDDLVDDQLRRADRAARAITRAAEIVNHDLGTAGRQRQRIGAAEAAAGPGNDGDAPVETNGVGNGWSCDAKLPEMRRRV